MSFNKDESTMDAGKTLVSGGVDRSSSRRSLEAIFNPKNVAVIGVGDHAEIWASKAWEAQCDGFQEEPLEDAMNLLGL